MKTIDQMLDIIQRVDGVDYADRDPKFIRAYYAQACKSTTSRGPAYARLDAAGDGDPDANDTNHRGRRGANSAVADPGALPDVSGMDLRAAKAVALSIGSYSTDVRRELATAILDRLRELGADQVADMFSKAWTYGDLDQPSDDESERDGAAHTDADAQAEGRRKSAAQARALLEAPGRADERRALMPATRRRSK